jgi:hypothetical protein
LGTKRSVDHILQVGDDNNREVNAAGAFCTGVQDVTCLNLGLEIPWFSPICPGGRWTSSINYATTASF